LAVVDECTAGEREIHRFSGDHTVSKRLLLVAYPLLPVSETSAGGAEQILWTLERELIARGWETELAACAGSQISGKLLATNGMSDTLIPNGDPVADDAFAKREQEHAGHTLAAYADGNFELVLDHSGHFFRHASRIDGCVLATLHLPRSLYTPDIFENLPDNLFFNCVSETQLREFRDLPRMLGVVRNGIAMERFSLAQKNGSRPKSDFVLWLGRVCPEKAPHLAIAAAQKAGLPIVVAGQVYPFQWHKDYWEREVKPLIDGDKVRWVELPSFAEKTALLRSALALLVTSQVAETTSLVALEAMASGTPVISFGVGALREVVSQGTGFIVNGVEEMAAACQEVGRIRPQDCRAWVAREYSAKAMADGYEGLIGELTKQRHWENRRR
jgi:glycosyltransferase involved in cell wall biosynthesis